MSSGFDLFGIPENPTLASLLPPYALTFSKLLDDVDLPDGSTGVPDPVTAPMSCFTYMVNKANLKVQSAQQRPMVRIMDASLNLMAELVGELSCTTEELMADTGTASLVCSYDNWIVDWLINQTRVDQDIHMIIDPIPTQRNWRTRWGGKIHQINVKRNEDGTSTIEIIALSMREHAKKLLIASNPVLPPEINLPQMWVLPGPIRTILFVTFFLNLARLFVPGLSAITNVFNPVGWINPLNTSALFNVDPLSWPIQVAFVNPAIDDSRWTAIGATWTSWHDATTDMLKDCGCIMRFYTYLKDEDVDSPYTELAELINGPVDLLEAFDLTSSAQLVEKLAGRAANALAAPTRNCVVCSLEDWSGQAGPTGTPLDGLLNLIGVTTDDLFTTILIDADTGQTLDGEPIIDVINPTSPVFETLLEVAPQPPKVIWRESTYDKVQSKSHTLYKAPSKTIMTGGKSPALVNEAQTFGIQYGLSQIQLVVAAGIGGGLGGVGTADQGGPPIGAGLSSIYQGQLDNSVLAWERITDPVRAIWTGDMAYQEHMETGSQTAYTLASIITLRQGDWNTRAYYGFQAQVISGFPWVLDVDVRLGERAGWEMDGIIYVDQVTAIKRSWDRNSPVICNLSVGDDKDKQDPIARGLRAINAVYGVFGALLGQGTLFG